MGTLTLNLEFAYNSQHTSTTYSPFMLTYGFQPHAPINVNVHPYELRIIQNFLTKMQDMLHIARDNIKTTHDRMHCLYGHNKQSRVFNPRQKVFLHVVQDSKTLSTSKCDK